MVGGDARGERLLREVATGKQTAGTLVECPDFELDLKHERSPWGDCFRHQGQGEVCDLEVNVVD